MTIFYVHWNETECKERIQPLLKAGFTVEAHYEQNDRSKFGEPLPDVFVFSLEKLPSHSKAIAEWVWEAKKRQHIPIIFEGGAADKVAAFKERFPKAIFVADNKVLPALQKIAKATS